MLIEADILLAQSAEQVSPVTVSALGMGWQVRPPAPIAWALVIVIRASRTLIGTDHQSEVALERRDGLIVTNEGGEAAEFDFPFTPEGLPSETGLITPLVMAYGFNLPPLPLEPGQEYFFRLRVDGETREHWVAPFRTSSA